VPPSLSDPTGRLQYDSTARELVLAGYLDPSERTAATADFDDPLLTAAVQSLASSADKHLERRGGSRLLSASAVRDLILRETSPRTRLAAAHEALSVPARRRVLTRVAANHFGIDLTLFDALDLAAQVSSPPTDVLAPLCSGEFATGNLHEDAADPKHAHMQAWLGSVTELRRVAALLAALRVHPTERDWFHPVHGFAGLAQLGFSQPAQRTGADTFHAWHRASSLYALRDHVPAGAATLEAIRKATESTETVDTILTIIGRAHELPADAAKVLHLDGLVTRPGDLRDPLLLTQVIRAALILRRLGATADVSASLCALEQSEETAAAARGLFAGKYGSEDAADGLRAASNALRERQRTALVDYLVHRDGLLDAADLHARYLLDVQMGADMRTSRIKQAISSVQLFTQRWVMNLDRTELPPVPTDFAKAWEWIRSYRVWEANRNVLLFTENWLEPSLRDDKSHLFAALESTLMQSEVTSERSVDALRQYLDGLDDISRLTVIAMYHETVGPRKGIVHLVGKTANNPVKYFYRQWRTQGAAGSWDPWEPLEVVGDTQHLVVFVRNGRPHVAWLDVNTAETSNTSENGKIGAPDTTAGVGTPLWAVRLAWSRRDQRGWLAPQKSSKAILHQKAINKDVATTFALRVEPTGPNGILVRCFGGSSDDGEPRPDPVPWQRKEVVISPPPPRLLDGFPIVKVYAQVLGATTDNPKRHIVLPGATIDKPVGGDVAIWAETPGTFFGLPFRYGTPTVPVRLTDKGEGVYETEIAVRDLFWAVSKKKLTIHAKATFGDRAPLQESLDVELVRDDNGTLIIENHDARFGFVFDLGQKSTGDDVAKKTDPNRRLRLFPIASGYWGSTSGVQWQRDATWKAAAELAWVGNAEHYRSGFQFSAGDPVEIFGARLGNPDPKTATQERIFVSASASDAATALDWPVYLEAETSASAGFVTKGQRDELTFLPATEAAHAWVQRNLDEDQEKPRLITLPDHSAGQGSGIILAPDVAAPFHADDPQFERALPYAGYDWELFFHAPMLIAHALATHQRYGEALRWLHTIFDPTATGGTGKQQWWRFPPFAASGSGSGIDLLLTDFSAGRLSPQEQALFQAQLDFSRSSPFRPDGIARMRVRAYQWMVVFKYLDVLIAWGDQQFRRDTIESINEATQLYLLANELLGRRPAELPPPPSQGGPPTFASLIRAGDADDWVPLTDTPFFKQLIAWLQYLVQRGYGGTAAFYAAAERLRVLVSLYSLNFGVPRNERLDRYWDVVEDRLVKIRNSQNIEGAHRRLPLFEPRIDPALLVQAVAAGLDLTSVLNETFAPPTPYRFSMALGLAEELCAEVKSFGAALLSALEKRDAEDLSRLRSTQEVSLLKLIGEFKQRQLDEVQANLTALRQSRSSVEVRYRHYQRLLGKRAVTTPPENEPVALEPSRLQLGASTSDRVDPDLRGYGLTLEEADHLGWLNVGNNYSLTSGAFQTAAGIAHSIPDAIIHLIYADAKFGGSHIGSALGAFGQFFALLASNANFQAARSSIIAGHQRRYDEWVLQSNAAAKEFEAVDKQILAAQIRVDLAAREIQQHKRQEKNAKSVDQFMREKFTATELYQWMADRLGEAHSGAYQLAYDLARRAQRSFAFELGGPDPGIVTRGAWDEAHRGLLAGERLSLDLKRLKAAYADRNRRELEITKPVSLAMLDPMALLQLQARGSCEFAIPEIAYDLDFAGHYFRRIKTVSVSLPCVVGPYTSVAGTLTLVENTVRANATVPKGTEQTDYRRDVVPVQSVAISTAFSDSGLFELNFRDERYLPFEGAGAISKWRFELPTEFRSFDYGSITDLVLHLRYTARDGGAALKEDASKRVRTMLATQNAQVAAAGAEGMLVRAVSLRHEWPTEWSRLNSSPPTSQTISIGTNRFPFLVHDRVIAIWKVSLYVRSPAPTSGDIPPLTITAPAGAYTSDDQPPIPWGTPLTRQDGATLYEFDFEKDPLPQSSSPGSSWPWTPITVSKNASTSWTVAATTSSAPLEPTDVVLAFWWRLAPVQPGRS
jgi:hypothetical protein